MVGYKQGTVFGSEEGWEMDCWEYAAERKT